MTKSELLKTAKPILFNTEMVRAILDGRKTVTRRVVKPQPYHDSIIKFSGGMEVAVDETATLYNNRAFRYTPKFLPYRIKTGKGDILYVRETWSPVWVRPKRYQYKATPEVSENTPIKWRPSIHMPKEAARIFLKVTDVKCERLQDINTKGIRAEGIYECFMCCNENCETKTLDKVLCGDTWISLWNSTIKKQDLDLYGWNANPWIWVYEFEKMGVENG